MLHEASREGGEDFEHEESLRQVMVPEDFLNDNLDQHLDDLKTRSPIYHDNIGVVEETSKKIPKWWESTIWDVQDDEMIEGQSSRGKSKNIVNFALMANI